MAELDQIYDDITAWGFFEGETKEETTGVYKRCPECGKYITEGKVLMNGSGIIHLKDWKCKIHGEIEPYWDRNC